jgi:cytochrome c biogenesis protein CcmG/thiol:disulfide interchange protein DsbE
MTDVTQLDAIAVESAPRRGGLNLASLVLLAGIGVMAAVIGMALMRQNQTQPTAGPAPAFSLTTFDGQALALAELRGKIVIVNFWASWCGPCREEAPALQSIWERYQDQDVLVVGVAYADSENGSLAFIEEFGLTYPNGADLGTRISDDYNIKGVPETFIIDQDGNIAEFIYAQVTEAQLSRSIERLMQAG